MKTDRRVDMDQLKKFITEADDIIAAQPHPGTIVEYRNKAMLVVGTLPDVVLATDGAQIVKIRKFPTPRFRKSSDEPSLDGYTVSRHMQRYARGPDVPFYDYLDIIR